MQSIRVIGLDQIPTIDLEAQLKQIQSVEVDSWNTERVQVNQIYSEKLSFQHFQSPIKNKRSLKFQQDSDISLKGRRLIQKIKLQKPRKMRVLINEKMRLLMLRVFSLLDVRANSREKIAYNIKYLAEKLNLSRSTINRKYRQFRLQQEELEFLDHPNQNSVQKDMRELEKILEFYQRQNLCESLQMLRQNIYLFQKKQFSNSQIIQGLGRLRVKQTMNKQLQFYLKLQQSTQSDSIFKSYQGFITNKNTLLFFSEKDYYTSNLKIINVALLCGEKGLVFFIGIDDILKRAHPLGKLLDAYYRQYGLNEKYVIVTGAKEIYKKNYIYEERNNEQDLHRTLQGSNGNLFPLPYGSDFMNLAKHILEKNSHPQHTLGDKQFTALINAKLQKEKANYTRDLFMFFLSKTPNKIEDDSSYYRFFQNNREQSEQVIIEI